MKGWCKMKKKAERKKNYKIFRAVAISLAASLLLPGCMPYQELKQVSIVEAVGIDTDDSGGYLTTFQIYKPQKGGGDSGSKKGATSEVNIIQSNGASIFDAVRNATLQMGRKLYFSNNRVFVIGEDICRTDMAELLDFMQRNQQIKPTEQIYAAKGKASEILTYKKDDEIVPAVNLEQISENYKLTSRTLKVQLIDIFKSTSNGITDPVLPTISMQLINDKPIMKIDGAAVLRNNRLDGYLDETETRGYLWITGKAQGGIILVNEPGDVNASMEILKESSKIDVNEKKGAPEINVNIKLSTNITEFHSKDNIFIDEKVLNKLKTLQDEAVKSEAQAAINKVQGEMGADIFDFGLKIYESKPDLWRKISPSWKTGQKNVKVNINVNSDVMHSGLVVQAT